MFDFGKYFRVFVAHCCSKIGCYKTNIGRAIGHGGFSNDASNLIDARTTSNKIHTKNLEGKKRREQEEKCEQCERNV